MGLAGVAIPALAIEIMSGSGHSNAALGGVMTAYGAGAALSPALAGAVAQFINYGAAFLVLGAIALAGLVAWVVGWGLATKAQAAATDGPRMRSMSGSLTT